MFAEAFGYNEALPTEDRFDDDNTLFGEWSDSPVLYEGPVPGGNLDGLVLAADQLNNNEGENSEEGV